MLIENVDYLVNAVALKLNTFDVSPYPPQVLLMMVKLSGAGLIPYLDDLVSSIFGILDMYHGYPKLVELLYSSLAAIVEEGTRTPELLAITEDGQENLLEHKKQAYEPLSVARLVNDIAHRRVKRARIEEINSKLDEEKIPHPQRPWTRDLDGPPLPKEDEDKNIEELLNETINPLDEPDESLPPPKDPEDAPKPLSKSHNLLLQIVKSIPPHLGSPSPFLRRSLLSLLNQAFPVLSRNQTSFLPLINELWPPVSSRIAPPSAAGSTSVYLTTTTTTTSLATDIISRTPKQEDDSIIKEETFVTAAACNAVTSMCELAGDFMASRVAGEYPRWRRLYLDNWNKVLIDAEKTLERQTRRPPQKSKDTSSSLALFKPAIPDLSLSNSTARSFTQHHILWRSLLKLFVNVLAHVRIPLSIGDELCEFIGGWIMKFIGSKYYFHFYNQRTSQQEQRRAIQQLPERGEEDMHLVNNALRAMEAWNKDLTWFIFWQGLISENATTAVMLERGNRSHLLKELERFNDNASKRGRWKFASVEVV
jgi:hypothetical protein